MIEWIKYCNLCNADVAEGVLTVEDEAGTLVQLDACNACVTKIPKGQWK